MDKQTYDFIYDAVEAADALIEHALELGHLGEGSTRGWATDVLLHLGEARVLLADERRKNERVPR